MSLSLDGNRPAAMTVFGTGIFEKRDFQPDQTKEYQQGLPEAFSQVLGNPRLLNWVEFSGCQLAQD
ncbi:hypothetical protein CH63R_12475 [Colletotrichum higginsianum IMI 349063]|uniref:Uncharacterized protein n=1 Tax=Colletotrichum higginsianum (strain IMI 349063) TaxID=759273 RepID=A0A1B7XUC8_COLHI|nr:hypothetical protein CH63R_12475 [Colletotrichum higginsianum IMI 349063]OBR03348.1 hypothetical protein CH63R_12475 [Colletotrichum higginsianum IMI 349063]